MLAFLAIFGAGVRGYALVPLYAMDYPYQYVPEEVAAMDRLQITEQEKAAFFQLNAEAVVNL